MFTLEHLRKKLTAIDGRGYKAYKEIRGRYDGNSFELFVDYVQGDPFAAPSRVRLRVPQQHAGFPADSFGSKVRQVALEDYLTRCLDKNIRRHAKGNRGTGKSGGIFVDRPGQQVLERTAVVVNGGFVEARLSLGLPARGRRVLGREAAVMLVEELPRIIEASLFYQVLPAEQLWAHIKSVEDQDSLRRQLAAHHLVAFVADGSILPRRSGISDLPLARHEAVAFSSPDSLRVMLDTPHGGQVTGMGVPKGVTLVIGGGYHGKSTLLQALERGVYNHIPGDGRERVVTLPAAVKIRAEDGRRVEKVNISPFINNLPFGKDTTEFSSEDASGSTSQAANIMEALETGSNLLLVDEDTSATNFMIRDVRMQHLVSKDKEPITPFIDRVTQLYAHMDVSTVVVIGGSGDYFDVADTVVMMHQYSAEDVTLKAKAVAQKLKSGRVPEGEAGFEKRPARVPVAASIDPSKGRKNKISARGANALQFGGEHIDLSNVEQLVDSSQAQAIGDIIRHTAVHYFNGRSLLDALLCTYRDLENEGLDAISPFKGEHPGDYAMPRLQEVAAALNRLRSLKCT